MTIEYNNAEAPLATTIQQYRPLHRYGSKPWTMVPQKTSCCCFHQYYCFDFIRQKQHILHS